MVFQRSAILNHLPDACRAISELRCRVIPALAYVIALSFTIQAPSFADGFPGKGNQNDWSNALPHYNLGNKYMQKERYEDAIAQYEKAVAFYQFDPDFYINLGVAWRKLENFGAAEAAFKKAAELNAKDWMSWSNLANSYLKQDRLEDTIKAFEQALKCNPPPEEKTAILKDIADIKKILSVRGGTFAPPAGSSAPPAKIISGSKGGASKKAVAPALQKQTAREAAVPISPKKNSELQDTGWDQVAK
jgi:tetratricopeptide (TPR) repeat protein